MNATKRVHHVISSDVGCYGGVCALFSNIIRMNFVLCIHVHLPIQRACVFSVCTQLK